MSTYYPITIPVKPYLRKYILWHNDGVEPLPVTRKSFPGLLLLGLLTKQYERADLDPGYTATITFHIHQKYADAFGHTLPAAHIITLNTTFDHLFRQELYSKVDLAELKDLQIKDAIIAICQKYGITEDDFSYDAFRKDIYRYRTKKYQKDKHYFSRFIP